MSEVEDLKRALKLSDDMIAEAHGVLSFYVMPGGISDKEAIERILAAFTGPRHLEQMNLTNKLLGKSVRVLEKTLH